jgi:hypothetical protein
MLGLPSRSSLNSFEGEEERGEIDRDETELQDGVVSDQFLTHYY